MRTRPIAAIAGLAVVLGGAVLVASPGPVATLPRESRADSLLPQRDSTFGAHILRLSEGGGYFDTDNLISNERSYLHVAPALRTRAGGGAYVGVGPDQNFGYIALLRPEVAYIVDIRRDNVLAHLLFKALFEASPDRAAYLAALTGRALTPAIERSRAGGRADVPDSVAGRAPGSADADRGPAPDGSVPLHRIVAWIDSTGMDAVALARAKREVRARIEAYGYPLSEDDHAVIERIHDTFARHGLSLRFASHGRSPQPHYPTYRDLLLETDRAGRPAGAFADEESYHFLRRMQQEDRIVPVVGDFAGAHALRAIAEELTASRLEVRAFYTSNVEYYLFRAGTFRDFAENVSRLPWHDDGVIVRSVFRGGSPALAAHAVPGYGSIQLAQRARGFLARARDGGYTTYAELTEHDVLLPD